MSEWPLRPISVGLLLSFLSVYIAGWRRLRRRDPMSISYGHLALFVLGMTALVLGLLSPIHGLSDDLLSARAVQQILLGLLAPPLLWLAAPLRVTGVTVSHTAAHSRVTRRLPQPPNLLLHPGVAWLLALSTFLIWHDPGFVTLSHGLPWLFGLAPWIFWIAYMLFWRHVISDSRGFGPTMPAGVAFLYIILGGEVPNMATGIMLAFSETPVYPSYAVETTVYGITPLRDQTVAGGLIWFVGSVIYVASAIGVLGRLFRNFVAPAPPPITWHATKRTIAPGLEERIRAPRLGDLPSHHH